MPIRVKLPLSRRRFGALHALTDGRGAVKVSKDDLANLLDGYSQLIGRVEDTGTELVYTGDRGVKDV